MRPSVLNPLFASASGIKGIGQKLDKVLAQFLRGDASAPTRIVDLLFHLPSGVVDRRFRPKIADLPKEGIVTIEVKVGRHTPPPPFNKRLPYRVEVSDETGSLTLVFFHAFSEHLQRSLPEGETRFISGEISWYGEEPQIAHPDHILTEEDFSRMPLIEPVYPLTAGLSPKILGRAIRSALERLPELAEWQDAAWKKKHGWADFSAALKSLHSPQVSEAPSITSPTRLRLAYDELLANQLALSLVRGHMKRAAGRSFVGDGARQAKIIGALPYKLTSGQTFANAEIQADMTSPARMLRLLQGDVGSGKTIVALLALATAVECGAQGTFMVPTEILARQHLASLTPLCSAAGISIAVLTGREKGKLREDILERLAAGKIDILIGTHALFQEEVEFKNLGLVVIDEQHRFGVHQRLALQAKAGSATELLVMTATPIPRTLALTVYGDMDVSKLTEKPAGRLPIDTRVLPLERMDEVVAGLGRSIRNGQRAYWVCPLVEESELVDLAAAEDRFKHLEQKFPGRVGLIHGRLKGPAKDSVMADFKSGALDILVSTTVIEVGVDVPEASIMVIENAERFGLAQLHQLRGRVGRGAAKSTCLLLYQEPLGETAKARLTIMRETEDGFRIAEEDLRLRGAGEMLGTQQAGLPLFRIADLSAHGDLLAAARDDAALILARDAELKSARGEALRTLLYLFERDEAVKLLSAG
ncbi:MAG TPA: ATP-dependent DNA helicase RecG [Aestuariivirga sp.]|nr:ATP-dependent DNA helicase RecG [Aestuariivirga sp.]